MTALGLAGYVVSLALLVAMALGEALGAAWRMRLATEKLHPWALTAPQLAFGVPVLGASIALVSLLPSTPWQWLSGLCACEALPGQHVCPFHFGSALGLAMATMMAAALLLIPRLRAVAATLQRNRDVENLAAVGDAGSGDVMPVEDNGRPLAFVAGLRRPRLFVERNWWAKLDDRERDVIVAHERAHIDARDPRTAALLDLLLACFAPRARAAILADWMLATEVRADAAAAQRDGDPLYVAEVLCRYARTAAPRGTFGIGGHCLEARVQALLDGGLPAPATWSTAACATAFLAACAAGHVVHALIESLLPLIS